MRPPHGKELFLNSSASPGTAPLCPIPRKGIDGSAGVILHIFLLVAALLVGVSVIASSPYPAVASFAEIFSAAGILLLAFHLWRITRTARAMLPLFVVAGVFLTYLSGSILPAGAFCGLIFILSEGSLLIAVQPKSRLLWLPLIPIAAFAVTALLSRDLLSAASVLLPWPAAIVLAQGTRSSAGKEDGPTRVGVICAASLAFGLTSATLVALTLLRALGSLSPEVLVASLEEFREALTLEIVSQELPAGLHPETVTLMKEMLTYDNVRNLIDSAINLTPGILTAVTLILIAACQTVLHAALRTFGMERSITDRVKAFRMSLLSCLVFTAAGILMFLDRGAYSTFSGTVAQNVFIILLPGLALAGLLRLVRGLTANGTRNVGCLFYLVLLFFGFLVFAPYLLAAVEVIGHVFSAAAEKLKPDEDDDGSPF